MAKKLLTFIVTMITLTNEVIKPQVDIQTFASYISSLSDVQTEC